MRKYSWSLLALVLLMSFAVTLSIWVIDPGNRSVMIKMAPWLIARSAGVTSYLLLWILVSVGLLMSSVPNKESWRSSKFLLPFHRMLSLFLVSFLLIHIVSIIVDPYAKVGWLGAIVPFLSNYRSLPVAMGSMAFYAVIISGLTARYTRLLPSGKWLTIHRFAFITFVLAFLHSVWTGTDTPHLRLLYDITAVLTLIVAFLRYVFVPKSKMQREFE